MSKTLVLARACEPIVESLTTILSNLGYQIVRSFDLQSAHHHAAQCMCQYVVLMVYPAHSGPPLTIVLHEFENATRIILDDPDGTLTGLLQTHLSQVPPDTTPVSESF